MFGSHRDELIERNLGPLSKRFVGFWVLKRLPGALALLRFAYLIAQRKAEEGTSTALPVVEARPRYQQKLDRSEGKIILKELI